MERRRDVLGSGVCIESPTKRDPMTCWAMSQLMKRVHVRVVIYSFLSLKLCTGMLVLAGLNI